MTLKRIIELAGITLIGFALIFGVVVLKINKDGSLTETDQQRVARLYHAIVVQTGLSNLIPPIRVVDSPVINAYNSGSEIVIYTGIIKATVNDDELAMIIAHEISHTTLFHFALMEAYAKNWNADSQALLESDADKMGAFYALKAGYNVCLGREIWKRLKSIDGDYLGEDHPDMAYRYDQLNVNCSE